MKKELKRIFLLTIAFLIVTALKATAAPVGIDNINEFISWKHSPVAGYSSYEIRAWDRTDMNPDDLGDYSRWSRTYTFASGRDDNARFPMSDMHLDDTIGIEYSGRHRPEPAPVPEPRTIALLGIGLISAGVALRKRLIRNNY